MKLSVALRLGRVSTLPTVTSSVMAAVALAGGSPSDLGLAVICVAMSMMYVAGAFLNDAFDREADAREHPERPIPAGEVKAAMVFDAGFALLIGGIALTTTLALVSGTGWRPIVCAIALGSLIIIHDAYHKDNPWSPIVMGLCRVAVYATAAFATTRDVDPALAWGMVALLGYVIGLAYIARDDKLEGVARLWPLAIMAVPCWIAFPHNLLAWVSYGSLLVAMRQAVMLLGRRNIREAVALLIAGIALLDATFAANQGYPILAIDAVVAFAMTRWLQQSVPGT